MNIGGAKGSLKYSHGDFWRWKAPESQEFASFRAFLEHLKTQIQAS